ncbi:unnamed protein product [Enterobius vermicularis]|uniref:DM domain-containing protein n=1 Tax=Enterobius vermicularis TaxID=51028 RepID=A0A0N4VMM6_ENTVE|nr:unnamed protein product [Enterobius vermicularis]
MTATSLECKRYYAITKKIPKDVKRYCGMCRQHNLVLETRGHNCPYKNCSCSQCSLVKQRRKIMRTQIRLRRAQEKRFQRTMEPQENSNKEILLTAKNMCYFCQKCKNHGVLMWKKDHKRLCRYLNCDCEQCVLIETRRQLDQNLKKSKNKTSRCIKKGVIEYGAKFSFLLLILILALQMTAPGGMFLLPADTINNYTNSLTLLQQPQYTIGTVGTLLTKSSPTVIF